MKSDQEFNQGRESEDVELEKKDWEGKRKEIKIIHTCKTTAIIVNVHR